MKKLIQGFIVCGLFVVMGGTASGQTLSEKEMDAEYQKAEAAKKNKNWSRVLEIVKPLAEQGHAKSQGLLAGLYVDGLGVTKDLKEGFKWAKLAADQGYDKGQTLLGLMYNKGWGVTKDIKESVKWFQLAADQGEANGQKFLQAIKKAQQKPKSGDQLLAEFNKRQQQESEENEKKRQQAIKKHKQELADFKKSEQKRAEEKKRAAQKRAAQKRARQKGQLIPTIGMDSRSTLGCPSGYQVEKRYNSTEIKMRWLGEGGEFVRCLNQEYPEKNNFKGSWGTTYGKSWFKCGDLNVKGYLSNPSGLAVCSKPGLGMGEHRSTERIVCKGRSIGFSLSSDESDNHPYNQGKRKKLFCKKNGESVHCFREFSAVYVWESQNIPKMIEMQSFVREIVECADIKF